MQQDLYSHYKNYKTRKYIWNIYWEMLPRSFGSGRSSRPKQSQLDLLHTTVSEGKVMIKSRQVQRDATGIGEVMPSGKENNRGVHRKGRCSLSQLQWCRSGHGFLMRNNADRDKRWNPPRKKHCVIERNLRSYDIRNTHCSFLYLG